MAQSSLKDICIVGNIASGKSTLTVLLAAEIPNSVAVLENFDDNPFLPRFTADPPRWAFTSAVRYFYDYARLYRAATAGRVFAHHFIDAGVATNRRVYARYLLEEGIVTPDEHAFYEVLCDIIQRAYECPEAGGYIFLEASPETCFRRMLARGWGYQTQHLQLAYLEKLAKYFGEFRDWVQAMGIPLLELDTEASDFQSDSGRAEVAKRVRAFLDGR